jgi:putative FmdB family regulatory protein
MPTYEYAPVTLGCSDCAPSFETFQKLSEDALTHCPTCKQPIRRVLSASAVISGASHVLKEGHFSKHGFTQYKKVEKGKYEKTAGPGPDTISGD